jgi:uncharacterized membrane protein
MKIKWIGKISWGKVLLVGLFYTILSCIAQQRLTLVSGIAAYITGVSITIIYYYLHDYLPKGFWKRSTFFADIMVSTSFLFFTLPAFVVFHVSMMTLGYWFVSSFVVLLVTSLLIVRLIV